MWIADNRHRILGWVWILLAVPSVLWWKDSIIWVILLSLYANAESSFAAHHAKSSETREIEGEQL
jgi:hypothetical protein